MRKHRTQCFSRASTFCFETFPRDEQELTRIARASVARTATTRAQARFTLTVVSHRNSMRGRNGSQGADRKRIKRPFRAVNHRRGTNVRIWSEARRYDSYESCRERVFNRNSHARWYLHTFRYVSSTRNPFIRLEGGATFIPTEVTLANSRWLVLIPHANGG